MAQLMAILFLKVFGARGLDSLLFYKDINCHQLLIIPKE